VENATFCKIVRLNINQNIKRKEDKEMQDSRDDEIDDWYTQYHQTIFKFILMMTKD
jgi:hypothetical protein